LNDEEPSAQQKDVLVKRGFAVIRKKFGDLVFDSEWSAHQVNKWLEDLLPQVFEHGSVLFNLSTPTGHSSKYDKDGFS
jgi:hypothetical protein